MMRAFEEEMTPVLEAPNQMVAPTVKSTPTAKEVRVN